jgi:DNA-binding transcriptional LysR family regulator
LGVRLFHRSTLAITLTPGGELFLESCRRIFSEINKIELEFSQSKATPKGRFKVSLPDVGTLMMPTLHGFMREYPEIQIDAEFTDNMVDVIDGGYDVVIRSGEQTDSRLMSKRLGTFGLSQLPSGGCGLTILLCSARKALQCVLAARERLCVQRPAIYGPAFRSDWRPMSEMANSRQRKMLAKRTRLNFVIGEVSRLPFERRIAPCRDDRMKSPTSSHLKSRGSSSAFTAAFRQAASES